MRDDVVRRMQEDLHQKVANEKQRWESSGVLRNQTINETIEHIELLHNTGLDSESPTPESRS